MPLSIHRQLFSTSKGENTVLLSLSNLVLRDLLKHQKGSQKSARPSHIRWRISMIHLTMTSNDSLRTKRIQLMISFSLSGRHRSLRIRFKHIWSKQAWNCRTCYGICIVRCASDNLLKWSNHLVKLYFTHRFASSWDVDKTKKHTITIGQIVHDVACNMHI
jgi:hypothetical protein